MKSARLQLKNALVTAAALLIAICVQFSLPNAMAQLRSRGGDGIFTPIISPVAINKTGRPFTVEVTRPEPSFTGAMVAGQPTGDSYIINFPNSTAGGPCTYTGTGRYFIESTGTLTFQILANCGQLKRGYSYMICHLASDLRCSEGPWWYFKDRKFSVTNRGVVINGATTIPWKDAEAPEQLQAMSAKIKAFNDRYRTASNVLHTRFISCRNFHPETKSYEIHELNTTCAIRSLCNGIPDTDSLADGDVIDWNSPVGSYVKQQNKISDVSTWVCWIRTQ